MSRSQGFTLLELMVVVAMVAIMAATALLALPRSGQRQLEQEAERLAAWLERGRAQSRASGQMIRMEVNEDGFRLLRSGVAPEQLRWESDGMQVQPQQLWLGPEPVIAPQQVLLGMEGQQVALTTDGVRPFALQWTP